MASPSTTRASQKPSFTRYTTAPSESHSPRGHSRSSSNSSGSSPERSGSSSRRPSFGSIKEDVDGRYPFSCSACPVVKLTAWRFQELHNRSLIPISISRPRNKPNPSLLIDRKCSRLRTSAAPVVASSAGSRFDWAGKASAGAMVISGRWGTHSPGAGRGRLLR